MRGGKGRERWTDWDENGDGERKRLGWGLRKER